MKPTKYEKQLFEKYGIDKLPIDLKTKILEKKSTTRKNGYRDSIEECESFIKKDVEKLSSSDNQFAVEFLTSFIGQRLKTIEYHETGIIVY